MLDFARNALLGVVAASALGLSSAQAATLIENGNTYDINYSDEFFGEVKSAGGAGLWTVTFNALSEPLAASALATVGNIVAGQFTGLTMSWIAASDGFVLASIAVPDTIIPLPGGASIGYSSLGTVFTACGQLSSPPDLCFSDNPQYLTFKWTDSKVGATFDVQVAAAVPLPAGGLLLIGAIGGLAALRRRKSA